MIGDWRLLAGGILVVCAVYGEYCAIMATKYGRKDQKVPLYIGNVNDVGRKHYRRMTLSLAIAAIAMGLIVFS